MSLCKYAAVVLEVFGLCEKGEIRKAVGYRLWSSEGGEEGGLRCGVERLWELKLALSISLSRGDG